MMRTIFLLLLLGPIVAETELESERKIGESKVVGTISKRRRPGKSMWMKWQSGNDELERRLEVAMCRTHCLPVETSCWSNCELFPGTGSSSRPGANRPARGRAGRRLKTRLAFPSQPLLVNGLDGRCRLTWPNLTPVPNSYTASPHLARPIVFLLVGSESNRMGWMEMGQTSVLSLPLPPITTDLSLLLLAVGKRGIRAKSLIKVKAGQCNQQGRGDRPSAPEPLAATKLGADLVRVELQWSGSKDASYVVRWQARPDNPITASLVTSKTKASITLEQNTAYSILVEMITKQGTVAISLPTIIDTKNLKYDKNEIFQANPMISGINEIMDEDENKNLFSKENSILFVILALFGFLICLVALCTLLRQSADNGSPSHRQSFGGLLAHGGSQAHGGSNIGSSKEHLQQKATNVAQVGLTSIKTFLGFLFKRSAIQPITNA